jgi:hypothetical protein
MKPLLRDEQLPALPAQVDAHADYTLAQHVELWAQTHGVWLSCPTMCGALQRAQRVLKKTVCATQRDESQRVPFRDLSQTLPVPRLVVVDESCFRLGLCPARARAAPGQRAFRRHPFRYGKSYSLLASLRADGTTTSRLVEGAVNRARFEAYIIECLAPTLRPGDIVAFHASSSSSPSFTPSAGPSCACPPIPLTSPQLKPPSASSRPSSAASEPPPSMPSRTPLLLASALFRSLTPLLGSSTAATST